MKNKHLKRSLVTPEGRRGSVRHTGAGSVVSGQVSISISMPVSNNKQHKYNDIRSQHPNKLTQNGSDPSRLQK